MRHAMPFLLVAACGSFADGETRSDAGSPATEAGSDAPATPAKLVFLTVAPIKVADGFLAKGDALCQSEASAAGRSGTFVAWLSTSERAAITALPATGRWATSAGEVVFDDVAAVASSSLHHAIDHYANGDAVAAATVRTWTNTGAGGLVHSTDATKTCQGFSSSNTGLRGAVGTPAEATDVRWTNAGVASCDSSLPLVCFER